ncbi:MAG: glycerol-3-phosphate acyltransferase [Bacteroidetes bacterium]|nr:glycerol-3-phosphate acyltransferase [Bacteroidota bacterium]
MDKESLEYILLSLLFYLTGSIPTSYIFLKWKTGKKITEEGSRNAGALNFYELSGSKLSGLIVLLIDFLKGFLPAFFFFRVAGFSLQYMFVPLAMLVIGHNFSVWLKFRGGRGLATAAGLSMAVSPVLLVGWCLLFLVSFGIYRKVHFGNIVATILLPVVIMLLRSFISEIDKLASLNFDIYFTFVASVCLIILLKHVNPFIDVLQALRKQSSK